MKKVWMTMMLVFTAAAILSCTGEKEKAKILESGTAVRGEPGYTYRIIVDTMQFNWKVVAGELNVMLKAPTAGWVSIGFNPTEGMKDANFIIGYVKDGKAIVSDQHGIDIKQHRKDEDLGGSDNVAKAAGVEKNNETEIRFTIPLKPADSLDKPLNINEDMTILLAYGQTKHTAQQHVFRSRLSVNLSSGKYAVFLKIKVK